MGRNVTDAHDRSQGPTVAVGRLEWSSFTLMSETAFTSAVLVTASELLLRQGAKHFTDTTQIGQFFGIAALGSGWTWAGIVCYVLGFASWLYVLRFVPLSVAFPVINGRITCWFRSGLGRSWANA